MFFSSAIDVVNSSWTIGLIHTLYLDKKLVKRNERLIAH